MSIEHEIHELLHSSRHIERLLERIEELVEVHFPHRIHFKENQMLPTTGGNTLQYTGTTSPAGSTFPADTVFTVTSNDPAILPTVDVTGLIVSVPLPAGWVENVATPLVIAYSAISASVSGNLTATITPSAPGGGSGAFPASIAFVQSV